MEKYINIYVYTHIYFVKEIYFLFINKTTFLYLILPHWIFLVFFHMISKSTFNIYSKENYCCIYMTIKKKSKAKLHRKILCIKMFRYLVLYNLVDILSSLVALVVFTLFPYRNISNTEWHHKGHSGGVTPIELCEYIC